MVWLLRVRDILELLYFASGTVIAVAAILALAQIKLTKKIANRNLRRESVMLAANLCKDFAKDVVPTWGHANSEYRGQKLTCLEVSPPPGQPRFLIRNGEFVSHYFDVEAVARESDRMPATLRYLNTLEAFAIPFAAGVADEEIGYRETARAFCQGAERFMPALFHLRVTNSGRFESIVKLYEMWSNRLAAEIVAPGLKAFQELTQRGQARIKPLDGEF